MLLSAIVYVCFVLWAFDEMSGAMPWFVATLPLAAGGFAGYNWHRRHQAWLDE